MISRIIKIITLGFFLLAVWIIWKEIRTVGGKNLIALIKETPIWVIALAGTGILLNYFVLSGYDWLALDYIGKKLPYTRVLKTAGISFAFSNTTGHTYAAGGAIRYWLYIPLGIPKTDILKIILFETVNIFIGLTISFEIAVFLLPLEKILPDNGFNAIGIGIFVLLILYIRYIVWPQKIIRIKKINLNAPSFLMTLKQIFVGLADNILLFLIFYTFLRYHLNTPILESFSVFIIAQSIGFMAQVPGGLGVFESSFLYLFPHESSQKSAILASLILFRIFYYFMPFILAILYLGIRFITYQKRT